ncbi:MAG: aspartate/glutamate racemase family protein [Bauldia sp.]|nr:aspartate/glutamate racemase family protein [Bauldia sp.]
MKLLLVNPNTTASMTERLGASARAVAAPGTEIVAVNPAMGPVSIEGYYDEAFSVPGLLEEIGRGERNGCAGSIVACFDDTGLDAARTIANGPVIGICEAAMHAASLISTGFSVVTTLPRSVRIIEDLALRYGMERRCLRVRAANVAVLDLEHGGPEPREKLLREVERARDEDGAEVVVLGCAGMTDLVNWVAEQAGIQVIDGVTAAVKLLEGLVGLGFRTSKLGAYASPLAKPYTGDFARFAPGDPAGG